MGQFSQFKCPKQHTQQQGQNDFQQPPIMKDEVTRGFISDHERKNRMGIYGTGSEKALSIINKQSMQNIRDYKLKVLDEELRQLALDIGIEFESEKGRFEWFLKMVFISVNLEIQSLRHSSYYALVSEKSKKIQYINIVTGEYLDYHPYLQQFRQAFYQMLAMGYKFEQKELDLVSKWLVKKLKSLRFGRNIANKPQPPTPKQANTLFNARKVAIPVAKTMTLSQLQDAIDAQVQEYKQLYGPEGELLFLYFPRESDIPQAELDVCVSELQLPTIKISEDQPTTEKQDLENTLIEALVDIYARMKKQGYWKYSKHVQNNQFVEIFTDSRSGIQSKIHPSYYYIRQIIQIWRQQDQNYASMNQALIHLDPLLRTSLLNYASAQVKSQAMQRFKKVVLAIICLRRMYLKPNYIDEQIYYSNVAEEVLQEILPQQPLKEVSLDLVQSVFQDFSLDFNRQQGLIPDVAHFLEKKLKQTANNWRPSQINSGISLFYILNLGFIWLNEKEGIAQEKCVFGIEIQKLVKRYDEAEAEKSRHKRLQGKKYIYKQKQIKIKKKIVNRVVETLSQIMANPRQSIQVRRNLLAEIDPPQFLTSLRVGFNNGSLSPNKHFVDLTDEALERKLLINLEEKEIEQFDKENVNYDSKGQVESMKTIVRRLIQKIDPKFGDMEIPEDQITAEEAVQTLSSIKEKSLSERQSQRSRSRSIIKSQRFHQRASTRIKSLNHGGGDEEQDELFIERLVQLQVEERPEENLEVEIPQPVKKYKSQNIVEENRKRKLQQQQSQRFGSSERKQRVQKSYKEEIQEVNLEQSVKVETQTSERIGSPGQKQEKTKGGEDNELQQIPEVREFSTTSRRNSLIKSQPNLGKSTERAKEVKSGLNAPPTRVDSTEKKRKDQQPNQTIVHNRLMKSNTTHLQQLERLMAIKEQKREQLATARNQARLNLPSHQSQRDYDGSTQTGTARHINQLSTRGTEAYRGVFRTLNGPTIFPSLPAVQEVKIEPSLIHFVKQIPVQQQKRQSISQEESLTIVSKVLKSHTPPEKFRAAQGITHEKVISVLNGLVDTMCNQNIKRFERFVIFDDLKQQAFMAFKFDLRSSVIANDALFYQIFRYVQLKLNTPLRYKAIVEKTRKNLLDDIKRGMQLTIDELMNDMKPQQRSYGWLH